MQLKELGVDGRILREEDAQGFLHPRPPVGGAGLERNVPAPPSAHALLCTIGIERDRAAHCVIRDGTAFSGSARAVKDGGSELARNAPHAGPRMRLVETAIPDFVVPSRGSNFAAYAIFSSLPGRRR